MSTTSTEDYVESLVSDLSTHTSYLYLNSSFSDCNCKDLETNELDRDIVDQSNYEMEEERHAANSKNNIIKILQEQLNTLHRKHKESIDEIESLKFKYNNARDELTNLKKICAQYESEIKKYESEREEGSAKKSSVCKQEGNLTDANLQGIAIKIADVEGKVEAVKQIVSESDMPENVSDDIDKVNNEFKNLLKRQYDRIEDILSEHSTKLDAIKEKVCGNDSANKLSKIIFSMPNLPINGDTSNNHEGTLVRANLNSSKTSLLSILRQTNEIYGNEIGDLRKQLEFFKKILHLGAEEFVEDVIEKAQLAVQPSMSLRDQASELKVLQNRNNSLQIENRKLKESLHDAQEAHKDIMLSEEEESTNHQVSVDTLKFELGELQDILEIREDTIDELEAEIETLNTKLEQLSNEQDNKEQHFKTIVDSNLQLSSEKLDTLKQQLDRISVQKQDTETLLSQAIREKDSISRNITVLGNTMQQYKNELEVKQAECAKYKEHVERLEEQIRNFDREMMEKDLQHERQMAKHKNAISDMEGKYRTSTEEMAHLRDTSQKLIALKGENETLIDEVEQLGMELQKFKGFECKDQSEMDRQMQKLQCFCKKLEQKLENTKAEISCEDSKKGIELKQHLKEKAILETQTTILKEELLKREQGSNSLLIEVDNYKDVIKDLTKTIQGMKRELDKYRCNNAPCRPEDIIEENGLLKEEMKERNCEITNLRLTLEELNRCRALPPITARNCQNQIQILPSCEESVCAMKELRKISDDMKNAQSKITGIVECNQEYSALLQNGLMNRCPAQKQQYVCPGQRSRCPSGQQHSTADTVNKLKGLKGRVDNLNQKEQELQNLLNELQRQNKKISRKCDVYGKTCYTKNGNQPKLPEAQKTPHKTEPAKSQRPSNTLSNDAVFNNYHNQLEDAVTKYKHVQESTTPHKHPAEIQQKRIDQNVNVNAKIDAVADVSAMILNENNVKEEYASKHDRVMEGFVAPMYAQERKFSGLARIDSMDTTRSQMIKHKSISVTPKQQCDDLARSTKVSIKIYNDDVLYSSGSDESSLIVNESPFMRFQSPIAIYSAELETRSFESLNFNAFYSEIPQMMYARRQKKKLTVYTEYNNGVPVISGGPLKCPYKFWQLHFHWGDNDSYGSEHTVNDKCFIMEIHAIHIKESASIEEAFKDPDGFVTLAYFYTYSAEDDDDMAMISIIQNFQRFDLRPDDKVLEFMAYFPLDLIIRPFHHQYVTYRGSRTDGSDVENVIWIFAPFTNKISRPQMEDLRNVKSQLPTMSLRPMQEANNRIVVFAEGSRELLNYSDQITSNIFLPINKPQN